MAFTYEELNKMTVAQLREIAQGIDHESVHGYSTMHKEKLLPAICNALGIDAHVHHHVVGINKQKIKLEIRQLKLKREEAIKNKDYQNLKEIRHRIHTLKHTLRKHMI
ncbi:MAG: hypothetical protein QME52_11715 [Bacteroidota bacterium]|nr:hypothetical protein [Bacteroidota bacterium]